MKRRGKNADPHVPFLRKSRQSWLRTASMGCVFAQLAICGSPSPQRNVRTILWSKKKRWKKRRKEKRKKEIIKETNGISNSYVAISHWFWPVWWLLPATSDAETGQCVQPVHDWSVLALFATNLLYICIENAFVVARAARLYFAEWEKHRRKEKESIQWKKKRHKRQMRKWKDCTPTEVSNWHRWRSFSITMERKRRNREEKWLSCLRKGE